MDSLTVGIHCTRSGIATSLNERYVPFLQPQVGLVVLASRADGETSYVVFEIKHSESLDYIVSGYEEAIVCRHEYAEHLKGWPKAVLISPRDAVQEPRRDDDVVAVGWGQLADGVLVDGLLEAVFRPKNE